LLVGPEAEPGRAVQHTRDLLVIAGLPC